TYGAPSSDDGAPVPIRVAAGDIFLGLDLCPDQVPGNRAVFDDLRRHGVRLYFVVYDLLPLLLPDMFSSGASPWFARWLHTVAGVADGLLCISAAVADELVAWLALHPVPHPATLRVGHFPLGADVQADPAGDNVLSEAEVAALAQLDGQPSWLMVGTLEPRKMHAQALDAFEQLWAQGNPVRLVIAGKAGWMTGALVQRIEQHPELGRRLLWLRHASDAALLRLYQQCTALLAASAGEGYGLPLIEAARHRLPILARDLPVFREVCGEHASYFSGGAGELAAALADWLRRHALGATPASAAICAPTWAASAAQLLRLVTEQRLPRIAPTLMP
ncbi:MAG: glycosyltransferase, partial [Pseudomonadota bacterium]